LFPIRTDMRAGQITKYQPQGWHERRTRYADAPLGAHHRLRARPVPASQEHQAILMLTYREYYDYRAVAGATGVSVRAFAYKLPAARQALARTLDLLDLL